jgi:hypothetical protein
MVTKIGIDKLSPTQLTLGLSEVQRRAAKLRDLPAEKLAAVIEEKAIPHVIGPKRRIYMLDHHHLARALWTIGVREAALGEEVADWSELTVKDFWPKMDRERYCWPIDADGNRRPYAAIPDHIEDLTDNIWRTLARELRGKAFDDLETPFQEFMWGDYFRTFMSRRLLELDYDSAINLAKRVARLDEAQDLPGYRHA